MSRMQTEVDSMQRHMSAMRTEGIKIAESVRETEKGISDLEAKLKLGMRDLRGEAEELRECFEEVHSKTSTLEEKVRKRKDPPPSNSKDSDKLHAALVSCQLNSQKTREDANATAKKVQLEISRMGELRDANEREWNEMKWELGRQERMVQSCLQLVETESSGVAKQLVSLWKELGSLRAVHTGHEPATNASPTAGSQAASLKHSSANGSTGREDKAEQLLSSQRAAQATEDRGGGRVRERKGSLPGGDLRPWERKVSREREREREEADRGGGRARTHAQGGARGRGSEEHRSRREGAGGELEREAEALGRTHHGEEGGAGAGATAGAGAGAGAGAAAGGPGVGRLKGRIEGMERRLEQSRGESVSPEREPRSQSVPESPET
eukprot:2845705-Rhodomonas_salina.1